MYGLHFLLKETSKNSQLPLLQIAPTATVHFCGSDTIGIYETVVGVFFCRNSLYWVQHTCTSQSML